MPITRLHVQGYRCLRDVDLELRPLTVLIGPNGSGKSSLLDVLIVLKRGLARHLADALSERGGVARLRTYDTKGPLALDLQCEHQRPYRYTFSLEDRGYGSYSILSETLDTMEAGRGGQRILDRAEEPSLTPLALWRDMLARLHDAERAKGEPPKLDPAELLLAQRQSPDSFWFRDFVEQIQLYAQVDVSRRSLVRSQQTVRPAWCPGPDGSDLVAALYTGRTHAEEAYQRLEEALRAAFPSLEKLEFPVVAAGEMAVTWHEGGVQQAFWPNQLSDGMIRYLWLCAILLSPKPPTVIMIDEPETSLHPQLLTILAGLMQEAATRTQVIVATQSAELVNWLKPEEVLVLDKEEGEVTAHWGEAFDLQEWLKEYTLGEAWVTGLIGGRS